MQRACGSAEVATDLARRSAQLYARSATDPDPGVLDSFSRAVDALGLAIEALRGQLSPTSLGPAA